MAWSETALNGLAMVPVGLSLPVRCFGVPVTILNLAEMVGLGQLNRTFCSSQVASSASGHALESATEELAKLSLVAQDTLRYTV